MAHIAVDARKYFDFGIGSYIQNLISALSQLNAPHTFTLFAFPEDLAKVNAPNGWHKVGSRFKKYSVGEIALLGAVARSMRVDLFHEPHYTLPIGLRRRSVVTIHDLIHLKMPQYFTLLQRTYARSMLSHAIRHSGSIIAVSQKTKEDIIETFGVKENDVFVVYNGIRPTFRRIDDQDAVERFRKTNGLERPFVLYVGNIKPHKNIPNLLAAFSEARSQLGHLDLVFAGGSCLGDRSLLNQARQLKIAEAIRDLHQLSDHELVFAYNAAELVVLPSLYEGFGFPALEAMACGTPTIVSNAGALPEIVGDAAVVIEPSKPDSLAEAMRSLLSNPERRASLVAKGKLNVQRFSWKRTAEQTLTIYQTVLERWGVN